MSTHEPQLWQIGLTRPDGTVVTGRAEAEALAATWGVRIDADEDREAGIWLATLTADLEHLLTTRGYLELTSPDGDLNADFDLDQGEWPTDC